MTNQGRSARRTLQARKAARAGAATTAAFAPVFAFAFTFTLAAAVSLGLVGPWAPGLRAQTGAPASPAPAAPETAPAAPAPSPAAGQPVDVPGGIAGAGDGDGEGVATVQPADAPGVVILPPDVQVVRFQGPEGAIFEVLSPAPVPVPQGDGGGALTVGLKRGVGYRLRISNLPERPGVEVFPVIEVVGHLHRPESIDPGKYPIRVIFTLEDLDSVINLRRLLTKVIYLEGPDQALPLRMPKDEIPVVTLSPTEHPLRVASALGRPMAIVRMGGRRPTIGEVSGGAAGDMGLDWASRMGTGPCPYFRQDGSRCPLPCGPPCTAPAPAPRVRSMLPRDEFLCDGGDRGSPAGVGPQGGLGGVDPRDAVVRFDIGLTNQAQPRVLPTNMVCIYAPRFAEVRVTTGTNATVDVQGPKIDMTIDAPELARNKKGQKRLVQNQAAELARRRSRASGMKGREWIGEKSDNRRAGGFAGPTLLATNLRTQGAELSNGLSQPKQLEKKVRLDGIKTAESPVLTGIVEGAGEAVKVWGPHAMTGVETPPDRPGLAVIKRVSASEAQPGDTVTYVIFYRNMGNTPIRAITIADSLLPRLEYVKGTSRGPKGTTFTSAVNRVGSTELRWTLPGSLAPGATGHVSFEVIIR